QARAGFTAIAGLQKPCPPTRSDQNDVATPDGHALRPGHVIQFLREDRIPELDERLHAAMAGDVEQYATRGDALAVDLVDAAVPRAETGHRVGGESVVELVLVVDVRQRVPL